jgi:serine/threonine-protein kinase
MAASPSPTADEQFAIGSVLDDRYRIEGVLGTGGMGRVYRAEHTKIGKSVAIKVLHADLNRNREASQRFQREALASGRLDHPNIVGVSDFGMLDDGACYLVMEVLEGESLGDRLARDKRIHWVEAIEILRGVLHGLRHAHERGVVHRDIKPDNVYLAHKDGDAMIKILDFGIAKLYAGSAEDPASTRAGLTVGTPAYLSPEQAVGGEITPASDLYSASIVMYEMLAGRAPFEDKDPLAMLGAHVSRRPPAFADVAPEVEIPPPLEDLIQHGLVKAAAQRIGTAIDYLAMLDAFSPPPHGGPRMATAPVALDGGVRSTGAVAALAHPSSARSAPTAWPATPQTPLPGSSATPGANSRPVPRAASVAGIGMHATPLAGPAVQTPTSPGPSGAFAAAPLPRPARMVSLAEVSEPIPLTWIVRSGLVIGVVIVAAIALALVKQCAGDPTPPVAPSPAVVHPRGAPGSATPRPAGTPAGGAAAPVSAPTRAPATAPADDHATASPASDPLPPGPSAPSSAPPPNRPPGSKPPARPPGPPARRPHLR